MQCLPHNALHRTHDRVELAPIYVICIVLCKAHINSRGFAEHNATSLHELHGAEAFTNVARRLSHMSECFKVSWQKGRCAG